MLILNVWTFIVLKADKGFSNILEVLFTVVLTSWPIYVFLGIFYLLFRGEDSLLINFKSRVPYYLFGFLIPAFAALIWVNYMGSQSITSKETMGEGLLIFGLVFIVILKYGGLGLFFGGVVGEIVTRVQRSKN